MISDDVWIMFFLSHDISSSQVIEIISTLSRQLNKTGLPVLPVQVCQYFNSKFIIRYDFWDIWPALQGNHDVYLADQFPGVGDEEGWVEVYQVKFKLY